MYRSASILLASAAALGALGWSSSAEASSDGTCYPTWSVTSAGFDGCSSVAMLQPGNDTRISLLSMMLDARGIAPSTGRLPARSKDEYYSYPADAPFFTWDEYRSYYLPADASEHVRGGSRCNSDESGRQAFIAAVGAARNVGEAERTALVDARKGLTIDCDKGSSAAIAPADLLAQLSGAEAKAFAAYLDGAFAFYEGRQEAARAAFVKAAAGKDAWLRETARYMVARSALNAASEGLYDRWGYRDEKVAVDNARVRAAEDAFNAYLKAYPEGRYSDSARGLLRRVYWLGGDFKKLEAEYARLIGETGIAMPGLVEEIDLKFLPNAPASQHPMLLAVMDLIRMRGGSYGYDACCKEPLTAQELAGQADIFRQHPALFEYLKAAQAFYVANNPAEVLRLIPDAARQKEFSHIQFARQMLRGEALAATKDRNARGFWLEMLPGAKSVHQRSLIQLAIADLDEKSGQIARVFAKDSPVTNTTIRRILLRNSADAALLRAQAKDRSVSQNERDVALFTLLEKQLRAGLYKPFLSDLALLPAGLAPEENGYIDTYYEQKKVPLGVFAGGVSGSLYPCPQLKSLVTTLAANPNDTKGQLCLADFMRQRLDSYSSWTPEAKDGSLGSTRSPLDARPYSRMAVYQKLLANPRVTGNDRAWALNRAIRCFERSGFNHCGDQDIPESQRRAWFQQLKRDYPNNPIATSLKYYW